MRAGDECGRDHGEQDGAAQGEPVLKSCLGRGRRDLERASRYFSAPLVQSPKGPRAFIRSRVGKGIVQRRRGTMRHAAVLIDASQRFLPGQRSDTKKQPCGPSKRKDEKCEP